MPPDRDDARKDPPGNAEKFTFSPLKHPIMLHGDVVRGVENVPHLNKRLGLVLQHLAAHGRTSVVKGCAGVNSGWRRSPLGGNGGMQFYLWWAPDGSPPTADRDENLGRIWARKARHHDDHDRLHIESESKYEPIGQEEFAAELVGLPDTDEQRRFVQDTSPIRVVKGHPGSGKTTALWKAVEARSGERVLYVSWSTELVNLAVERLNAFAPSDVDVYGRDFLSLLGVILGKDVRRVSYERSRAAFDEAVAHSHVSAAEMGAWSSRRDALYAETRAILLGRAIPAGENCDWITADNGEKLARLTDAEYMRQRGGVDRVGEDAARDMLNIAERLKRRSAAILLDAFPELAAAAEAVERLKSERSRLPDALAGLDRVAVDEVQDMTLAETAAIVELCIAVKRQSGRAPFLLIAGDEGQTVRPSGFEWANLKRLISDRIADAAEFTLDETLRSPQKIAAVEERASELYSDLHKVMRPRGQRNISGGDSVNAQLFYVNAPNEGEAAALLGRLGEIPELAVTTPERNVADWLPDNLKDAVLTPAVVKGMEYQTVCVLEPGRTLKRLFNEMNADASELPAEWRRVAIDGLRVALSRATENLAFIDVGADESVRKKSLKLLGDSTIHSPEELLDYLENMDMDAESAVSLRMGEAREMIDSSPGRAWQLALQAVNRLGASDSTDAITDATLRTEAHTTLLRIAAKILVEGTPARVERRDVVARANDSVADMGSEPVRKGFAQLEEWTANRAAPPFDLLNATASLGEDGDWLRSALNPNLQALIESLSQRAGDADAADRFSGDVERWLDICEYADNRADRARELRRKAASTLLAADRAESAGPVIEKINPEDLRLSALHAEKLAMWDKAIELYRKDGANDDVRRVEKLAAKSYFDSGISNAGKGSLDAAIDDFTNALRFDADYRDAYYHRGGARLRKGDADLAIDDFSEAARLRPDDADAYNKRGQARMAKGETDAAIADFTNAISVSPRFADAYRNRAAAYSAKSQADNETACRIERERDQG